MVEGKEGLRAWKEAVHIFQSEDQETAFQQALAIGRQGEEFHEEGRREVETRLAEVVRLPGRQQDQLRNQSWVEQCTGESAVPTHLQTGGAYA
jgi:hypothetical protein